MYIRAATPSTESVLLSYTSVYPECPPAGPPHCAPTHMSPGPALPSTAQPSPETAYAADIQQFGQRNFVGLIVLGVFVSVGLVLWLTFGTWPKAFFWRIRERFTRRRGGSGDEAPGRGAAGPEEVAAVEYEKGPRDSCGTHSEVKVKRAAVQVASSSSDSTFVSDTEVGRLDPEKCLPPEVLDEGKTLPIVRYA